MKFRDWIVKKLLPEEEWNTILMNRVGFRKPKFYTTTAIDLIPVHSEVVLDEKSYEWLHTAQGEAKYDVVYGLTRQMADELKQYVKYEETYDPSKGTWKCRASIKVVKL